MFLYELSGCWLRSICVPQTSNFWSVSRKEFLVVQATMECGFSLKRVRHIVRTYPQMNRTDKYSRHSSIIYPIWLNSSVLFYKVSDSGFKSSCMLLSNQFCACFEQRVPRHSGNSTVYINSEKRTWHNMNIQPNVLWRFELTTKLNHLDNLAKWFSVCLGSKTFRVWVKL